MGAVTTKKEINVVASQRWGGGQMDKMSPAAVAGITPGRSKAGRRARRFAMKAGQRAGRLPEKTQVPVAKCRRGRSHGAGTAPRRIQERNRWTHGRPWLPPGQITPRRRYKRRANASPAW